MCLCTHTHTHTHTQAHSHTHTIYILACKVNRLRWNLLRLLSLVHMGCLSRAEADLPMGP